MNLLDYLEQAQRECGGASNVINAEARQSFIAELSDLQQRLAFAEDAAQKGDLARSAAGGMELEIAELREWKRQQLTVTAWWQEIDTFVRNHPDVSGGDFVSAAALSMLRERDTLKAGSRRCLTVQLLQLRRELYRWGGMSQATFTREYLSDLGEYERRVATEEGIEL